MSPKPGVSAGRAARAGRDSSMKQGGGTAPQSRLPLQQGPCRVASARNIPHEFSPPAAPAQRVPASEAVVPALAPPFRASSVRARNTPGTRPSHAPQSDTGVRVMHRMRPLAFELAASVPLGARRVIATPNALRPVPVFWGSPTPTTSHLSWPHCERPRRAPAAQSARFAGARSSPFTSSRSRARRPRGATR